MGTSYRLAIQFARFTLASAALSVPVLPQSAIPRVDDTSSFTLTSGTVAVPVSMQAGGFVAPGDSLTVGAQITSLAVKSVSGSGSRPYAATVLLRQGQVPAGSKITNAAGTEVAAIGATYPDGSAAWAVLPGTASADGTVAVHVATGTAPANLTAAAVAAAGLTSVAVAFGSPYGTATITDFSTPERVWWATPTMICARYRVAAPTPGSTALEAVIDVHAWAGRALVEVVVENATVNMAAPVNLAGASYTGAVVSVNGSTIATVNGNAAPEGDHSRFRAWYASTWIGGDPGLRVTQAHADLQLHPLLFKCDQASTADLSTYASDAYTPWTTGRHRATSMGTGGDHPSIGPLSQWEARALQSGDYRAWKATEVNALALLGWAINYRSNVTGLVPTITELAGRSMQSSTSGGADYWPRNYGPNDGGNGGDMGWEVAHHPSVGLMAFLSRPSPVFIELAQKAAVWNATWSTFEGNADGSSPGVTGCFGGPYQLRGRAWAMRTLAHATFITPDVLPWRDAGKTSLAANVPVQSIWMSSANATGLHSTWNYTLSDLQDHGGGAPGFSSPLWQQHYMVTEFHKVSRSGLLAGSDLTAMNALTDWLAEQPVRWINDQAATGGWRFVPYSWNIGTNATTISPVNGTSTTWADQMDWYHTDSPASLAGSWYYDASGAGPQSYSGYSVDSSAGTSYSSYFWSALCVAVDRAVSGASTAWSTMLSGITTLATWRQGFGTDPRWGNTPLNPPSGWATGAGAGTYSGDTWTPARTSGVINRASWDLVPAGKWSVVAGTGMRSQLLSTLTTAFPGWTDWGDSTWDNYVNSWSAWTPDVARARAFSFYGGHSNGSNNGVYSFGFYTGSWSVEIMPSDPSLWSYAYQHLTQTVPAGSWTATAGAVAGTFSYCAESDAAAIARPRASLAAVNDWFNDEVFWDHGTGVGKPTARHTYQSGVYVPSLDAYMVMCRRLWKGSLASDSWTYKRQINDNDTGNAIDGEHGITIHDEVTGELLSSAGGSAAIYNRVAYNLGTDTWTLNPTSYAPPWAASAVAAAVHVRVGRNVVAIYPGDSRNPDRYWIYNLDSRTATVSGTSGFTYSGLSGKSYWMDDNDAGSLVYIEHLNRYWLWWRSAASGMQCVEINPTTTPWTMTLKTDFTGAVPAHSASGINRAVYVPDQRAVWFQAAGSTDLAVYKF